MVVLLVALGGLVGEDAWANATVSSVDIQAKSDPLKPYAVGEDINVHVVFSAVVHVDETPDSGELVLSLNIGEHSRDATFIEGSGTTTLKFRYTVQYGDEDTDGISIGPGVNAMTGSLTGGVVVVAGGTAVVRTFMGKDANSAHKVDGIKPKVTTGGVAIADRDSGDTHALGDDIEVTVTFDEVVHVDETVSELVLVLSIGQHSRRATLVDGSGSKILKFSYTVQRGDLDEDGISIGAGPGALQGASVQDFAGNEVDRTFDALPANDDHKVDGVTASLNAVRVVSMPSANMTYGLNEEIRVVVDFGEKVYVSDPDDNLELVISIGGQSRSGKLAEGSGTNTLTFAYVVQSDDEDNDGISVGPTALRGGILEDAAGNPVDRNFGGLEAQDEHMVDGVRPSLREIRIESDPDSNNQIYGLNEEITVHVVFDEEVHVDETEGELVLVLAIGQHSRQATFIDGSGTGTLMFSYTVQSDDKDSDGISVGPRALQGAVIEDKAGNLVDRTFAGLEAQADHKVDGTFIPRVPIRIVSTPVANSTYGMGEQIRVEVNFDERVYVTGDLKLVLAIGDHPREATLAGGNRTNTLTFRHVVQPDDRDDDGISIATGALTGGTIKDGDNNAVVLPDTRLDPDSGHKVDGISPSLSGVRIVVPRRHDGIYGLNEEIQVEVEFGEVVHVTDPGQAPTLLLSIGENLRPATLAGGSGTDTLTFSYVVQSDDYDDDGISIGANALEGGGIEDAAGNPVERTFAGLPAASRHKVDGVIPVLDRVGIVSPHGHDDVYGRNEEILIEVDFGEEVHVKGTVTVDVTIGEHTRQATFVSGSGTDTLTFRYVVQADDYDDDGISIPPNCLTGTVVDAAGNAVDDTYRGRPPDRRHRVDGSATPRLRVYIVAPENHDGIYGVNEEIRVAVDFPEEVHVTGAPTLTIAVGENSRMATLADGSGTKTLTFSYVVQSDDQDDDGISIGPNALQGGVIENAAGVEVERTFVGLTADDAHKVDGVSPSLTAVRIVSPAGHDGIYGLNEEIRVAVDFEEEVHVKGTVTVDVTIGEHTRQATFVSGSGTSTLTFRYVVQPDDYDDDGISIPPNCLSGTVVDVAGNPVIRTYRGRSPDIGHKVDGVSPSLTAVRIVSPEDHDGIYGLNEEIRVEVDFGEEVHVTGDVSLMLSIGEHLRVADLVGGSGTETLAFRYIVQPGDSDDDGISIGPNALRGNGILDAADNTVVLEFDGLTADGLHKVDGVSPSLTKVRIVTPPGHDGTYRRGAEITVKVDFSEDVHVTGGEADLAVMLSIGQHLRTATFVDGGGTDTLTFRYVVQAGDSDEDGISIGPNGLQGGTIEDAAGNVVVRTFNGLPANRQHKVKTVPDIVPAVETVSITSDAGPNGTYTTDDDILFDVVFNVPVYVTGEAPILELSIGSVLKNAIFQGGSGTQTLKFLYTVELGDTDDDGISVGPNALTGTVEDGAGNAVDLTLPALVAQQQHKVSAELMLYPLSITLLVGQAETINLSSLLGELEVNYDGHFFADSDDQGIATAAMAGRMLTITSVAEGAATITAKAVDAAIYLIFGVTVATSPEEKAVLEGALAAVGRGLIASAASTIGARLESSDSDSPDVWGGRGLAPGSEVAPPQWTAFDGIDRLADPFDDGPWGRDDPYLERSMGYTLGQWLRGARFEMPFGGFGNPINSWSVWGAGDWHAFEGEPESGLYNGSLTSIYLGVDAKGNGWISGAAFSHAIADASYEFGGDYGGEGRLETELNVIHPYVQWAFRERGKMWAILGLGAGEATAEREGQEASRSSSDLSMLMGLGGMRYAFGPWAGFDFAVRGDAGFAKLETDEGPRAIEGLMVNVQRLRMGVEASLPMALAGVPVSPFIDIGGRYDGGDGATGGGLEMAGGFRYRGPMVGFEMKARALAMHTDESYSEEGVKATLIVGPDGRRGFRVMLAPRWGGTAESMDIFSHRGHPLAGSFHGGNRGWGLGTRISYGFDMRRRPGTIMPYWELDLSRDAYRQARLGVSYELASAFAGMPHRLELSSESTENDRHGSIMRFLLSGQAHF